MQTWLMIGLGNPGAEYQNTRHNIGWMFLDYVAKKKSYSKWSAHRKEIAQTSAGSIEIERKKSKVLLAKSNSFVNVTGKVVAQLAKDFRVKANRVIAVHDDLDIPFGSFKLSFEKNSGGHRGVESIIRALKTKKFWRMRLGTQSRVLMRGRQQSEKKRDDFVRDFVLSPFSPAECTVLHKIFKASLQRLEQI